VDSYQEGGMSATNETCPICGEAFERMTYEGARAMRCTGCGGYLVKKTRLQGIQRRQQYPREALQRSLHNTMCTNVDSQIMCPRCRTPMEKDSYNFGVRLEMDVCPECQSVWLDPGELEQAQMEFEQSLTGRDLQRLKHTWEEMPEERRREFEKNRERLPKEPLRSREQGLGGLFMSSLLRSLFGRSLFGGRW
jgi:Zn-finger nucleic acid-binding protein